MTRPDIDAIKGWKLVPVEATRPQTIMAENLGAGEAWAEDCYTAMLAASPSPADDEELVEEVARVLMDYELWPGAYDKSIYGNGDQEKESAQAKARAILAHLGGK